MANMEQEAFLTLTPTYPHSYSSAPKPASGFKIAKLTSKSPQLERGQVAVRLLISLDSDTFAEFIPTVSIDLASSQVIQPTITIEAMTAPVDDVSGSTA